MRFPADTVASGTSFLAVEGTSTTLSLSCDPNGDGINTRLFGTFLGGEANETLFLVPNGSQPGSGYGAPCLRRVQRRRQDRRYLEDDNGVSYRSFTEPTLPSGNPPWRTRPSDRVIKRSLRGWGQRHRRCGQSPDRSRAAPSASDVVLDPHRTSLQGVGRWSFDARTRYP
jgi:hypothetical protein